ncbi:MAG: TatD family hydrolase [Treponema sp.]|jgi:hypothetical protein|nr:TatD family hydrolase [Treponema sp.]
MARNVFTPLKTAQGLPAEELRNIVRGRSLYIWGAGFLGRCVKSFFERNSFNVMAFLDINPALTKVDGLDVFRPADILANVKKENAFIVLTVASHSKLTEEQCIYAGLEKDRDFLTYIQIPRQQPVIEIGGVCNYACSVCIKQSKPDNYMSAAVYKKVFNKLIAENPMLISIDLSLWREPLLNPDIAEITRITKNHVPCKLVTKLQCNTYLEELIKADPGQIQIIAGGYEKTYEQNQTGKVFSWPDFVENIHKIKMYKEKYNANTSINLLYIMYKNSARDFEKMKRFCSELGITAGTDAPYLTPYDNFLDICEERELDSQIQKIKELITWDMEKVLKICEDDAHKPCICQRIFPVIDYDTSVSLCHLFCKPRVCKSFLDTPYNEIAELRLKNDFCRKCQSYGLHRLDLEILKRYYPQLPALETVHKMRR